MTIRLAAAAAVLLALGLGAASAAQGLQPGMRTMMQQGGIEHGNRYGRVSPRWRRWQRRGIRSRGLPAKRMMRRRRSR